MTENQPLSPPFPADDRFVRFTFADTQRMAGLLREFLPSDLQKCLDLSRLKRIHEQHIRENLREHRDDLDLECPMIPDGRVFIRVLVEHKSHHDQYLWLQLQRSIVSTWERVGFSPVIPVVIHTGPKPFAYITPQNAQGQLPGPLHYMQPTQPVQVIDLGQCPEERIWNSANLDPVARVGLTILRLAQQESLEVGKLRNILRLEWPDMSPRRRKRFLEAAIFYIRYKTRLTKAEIETLRDPMPLVHPMNPHSAYAQELREREELRTQAMTEGRAKGLAEGRAKGRAEGHAEGIAEGRAEGQAEGRIQQDFICAERMLAEGLDWALIERVTGISREAFHSRSTQ